MNLIGYCEEDEPFVRMMVFEYAPNGSLSEHLHGESVTIMATRCLMVKKLSLLFMKLH